MNEAFIKKDREAELRSMKHITASQQVQAAKKKKSQGGNLGEGNREKENPRDRGAVENKKRP